MQLVVAEKPSVARDLARILGVPARGKGAFRGTHHVITWCIGHLVELEEPAAYDPAWKRWRLESLPMLPPAFKLRPVGATLAQWLVVRDLLRSREFHEVVNACDAGREGEHIFRTCCELAGAHPPVVRRLWISSLTDAALRAGLARLRPAAELDPLGDAARCRAEADWLVGMNATRAVTARARSQAQGTLLSIGRVQTPTLALVVAREAAIRAFVSERYDQVVATLTTRSGASFAAIWTGAEGNRLAPAVAAGIAARAERAEPPRVAQVERELERVPPPMLFDLTTLQKTANRRFGLSAQRTLEIAQALYERHKLISYPRTDSRHLPAEIRTELPAIFAALAAQVMLASAVATATPQASARLPRVFDSADGRSRVGDHHAIIPTARRLDASALAALDPDTRRLHDLIVRRFLGVFHPDAELARTTVTVAVASAAEPDLPPPPDLFRARGVVRLRAGWQDVAGVQPDGEPLPPVVEGEVLTGVYAVVEKQTEPPRRFTEATLLAAMESAGKELTDDELRDAMLECGLGTPATRAQTIETLLSRGYLLRSGKQLTPTSVGITLIEELPAPSLASPELTGQWEARLARVARGEETRTRFMQDIRGYVAQIIATIRTAPAPAAVAAPLAAVGSCPRCSVAVVEKFKFFACSECDFKLWKMIAGKKVTAPLAALLLRTRRTRALTGFRSKAGKRFSAALVLDETGAVGFDFGPDSAPSPSDRGRRALPSNGAVARRRGGQADGGGEGGRASPQRRGQKPAAPPTDVACPTCRTGAIVTGRQAWGCSRWREGCALVVPFEFAGHRITGVQLRALLTRGITRKGRRGRLRLDATANPPRLAMEPPEP